MIKNNNMEYITSGEHTFEIIDYAPTGYEIWNIGKNMIDGYLPIAQVGGENGYTVNQKTLKAIKIEGAQTILAGFGWGPKTIKEMETYIKKYKNSKTSVTQYKVKRIQDALEVMRLIEWR
jgi:hypothetical protein